MIYAPKLFVLVGIRQQRQETRAFYGNSQLALVVRFGSGDAGGNDFAVFSNEIFQQINLFVIHFLDFSAVKRQNFLRLNV